MNSNIKERERFLKVAHGVVKCIRMNTKYRPKVMGVYLSDTNGRESVVCRRNNPYRFSIERRSVFSPNKEGEYVLS